MQELRFVLWEEEMKLHILILFFILPISNSIYAVKGFAGTFTSLKDQQLPEDFKYQGEYSHNNLGAQVIALGKGTFHVVLYPGGLPGNGWDGENRSLLQGNLNNRIVNLIPASGNRKYLAGSADEFSATRKFPPQGHKDYKGSINDGKLTVIGNGKAHVLIKTIRKSKSLGKKAPKGAIVLFDGTNKKEWQGGRLDQSTKLLNTDGKDIRSVRKFSNYTLHLEFMLPYRPALRGQGRGNSGLYQIDMYENQILDSFGLEGANNECGGIYSIKDSDVNACFPPLTWQTYDVEFTNAVAKNGKKIKNARITAHLNGIKIHNNFEIPHKTGGSRPDKEGTPGPIKLQGHGNPLQFRNIWIFEN